MAPWQRAVVALDCCLSALRLVAGWLPAWLADQPAGLLAAGWLTPILLDWPAGLVAGPRANWRPGPFTGLAAGCLPGWASIHLFLNLFPSGV